MATVLVLEEGTGDKAEEKEMTKLIAHIAMANYAQVEVVPVIVLLLHTINR